jgi:hypothetical protein
MEDDDTLSWSSIDDKLLDEAINYPSTDDENESENTLHTKTNTTETHNDSEEIRKYRARLNRIVRGTIDPRPTEIKHVTTEVVEANALREQIDRLFIDSKDKEDDNTTENPTSEKEDKTDVQVPATNTTTYPSTREWLQENVKIRDLNNDLDNLDALERYIEMKELAFLTRVVGHTSPELAQMLSRR